MTKEEAALLEQAMAGYEEAVGRLTDLSEALVRHKQNLAHTEQLLRTVGDLVFRGWGKRQLKADILEMLHGLADAVHELNTGITAVQEATDIATT